MIFAIAKESLSQVDARRGEGQTGEGQAGEGQAGSEVSLKSLNEISNS